ncbi:MAG: oxalurate catabolism protein HpxZ [Proteobacteria bacterium]|nr:oxalurate catabolism protein HpxZ [Pseudomonadota bacterium]
MEINLPEVLRGLTDAFESYEEAVTNYRPEKLAGFFWKDPRALRYGVAENLYGYEAIAAYRQARAKAGGAPRRRLTRTVITTFGRDFGVADTEYLRTESGKLGRQSQTWVRMPEGWRIVSAHVSLLQESDETIRTPGIGRESIRP